MQNLNIIGAKNSQKLILILSTYTHFSLVFHFVIETSFLICSANQMTGFYMNLKTELKWVTEDKR